MEKFPSPEEFNSASAFVGAVTVLVGIIIRAIEKNILKKKYKDRNESHSI